MAQFFKAKKVTKSTKSIFIDIDVDDMDHQGNGICLSHKPIVVVPAAIPGESYRVQILTKKQRVWYGRINKVLTSNDAARVPEFCPYVATCGGCSHQAFSADYLIDAKQSSLKRYLERQISAARLIHCEWEDTIKSDIQDVRQAGNKTLFDPKNQFGYRRRARIAIDARNTDAVKVGFRQEKSNKIVDIPQCAVLTPQLQIAYEALAKTLKQLPSASSIGHITLTEGKSAVQACLHLVKTINADSIALLLADQALNAITYVVETKAGSLLSVQQLQFTQANIEEPSGLPIGGKVPEQFILSDINKLDLAVEPSNFIQVNQSVNAKMIETAIAWLAPTKHDVVVDFFSGVGNFALALAPLCRSAVGIEGVPEMVQQARGNALLNDINNCRFEHCDLNDLSSLAKLDIPEGALFIVDPSRVGALELMGELSNLKPRKILYVSCNPTSFARDVEALPSAYRIAKVRSLDMFPFTKHIEMMALISSERSK